MYWSWSICTTTWICHSLHYIVTIVWPPSTITKSNSVVSIGELWYGDFWGRGPWLQCVPFTLILPWFLCPTMLIIGASGTYVLSVWFLGGFLFSPSLNILNRTSTSVIDKENPIVKDLIDNHQSQHVIGSDIEQPMEWTLLLCPVRKYAIMWWTYYQMVPWGKCSISRNQEDSNSKFKF